MRVTSAARFSRLPLKTKISLLQNFVGGLLRRPGFYLVTADSPVGQKLLERGIRNILVSEGAKPEKMVRLLGRVLGMKEPKRSGAALPEPSILFNIPASLAGEGALLFTRGQVEQTTSAESQYTKITLAEVRAGLTDFGEEMVRFMELNNIESVEILTELTVPRYQKMGFSGAVYGSRLGMRGNVSS
jgi:hypothetical protein